MDVSSRYQPDLYDPGLRTPATAGVPPPVVGSWLVRVPQPDGSTFVTVQSFTADGGAVTQFSSATHRMGASIACGTWRQSGARAFLVHLVAPVYDPESGASAGHATIQGCLRVDLEGHAWRGRVTVEFFASDGAFTGATREIEVAAERIVVTMFDEAATDGRRRRTSGARWLDHGDRRRHRCAVSSGRELRT
jgi:hypothetical protein